MEPSRWSRVADLFDHAIDLAPFERAAFLDAEALGPDGLPDVALRAEVERMLALDASAAGFLATEASVPEPGPVAGPWRLIECVGRGGMGEVWRAERSGAFEQTAAVKLVHPGWGETVAARLRAERQILAGLDHPAIARLMDGGTASDGRPYLAMEFVDGEPITAFADRHRLGVDARLALFLNVCDAVAYAHTRLVVHRDLKPSNVLVASSPEPKDGRAASDVERAKAARVKLLDFGIAKLLDASDETLTRTGRPLLTPAYGAPEQVAGDAITTATDVYALGVLLVELLTGTRPASEDTRLSDAVESPESIRTPSASSLRSTTPERLRRRLRGDLDRIAEKSLRQDPERRYRGAAELGADLQRHLGGLPVEARPESVGYRVGKYVRRNRALVAAAFVALTAVVGGAGVAVWQAGEARAALVQAQIDAADAEAATVFMYRVFEQGDARVDRVRAVEASQAVLEGAARDLQADTTLTPRVRAQLLQKLGYILFRSGKGHLGEDLLRESIPLFLELGDEAAAMAPLFTLADITRQSGRSGESLTLYREVIRLSRLHRHAPSKASWALLYLALAEPPNSPVQDSLFAQAIAEPAYAGKDAEESLSEWYYQSLRIRQSFGQGAAVAVDTARTLPPLREARRESLRLGEKALAAFSLFTEAVIRARTDPAEAQPLFDTARRETAAALGRDHARYAWILHEQARSLLTLDRPHDALVLADEAVETLEGLFGTGANTNTALALRDRAAVRRVLGHPDTIDDYDRLAAMWSELGTRPPLRAEADSLRQLVRALSSSAQTPAR